MNAPVGDASDAPLALGEEPFPRGTGAPRQSPLFWVAEKDRYLRQLLIRDIERTTGRRLIVYFADSDSGDPGAQILPSDDAYMAELLGADPPRPTDLMIETNGGDTDATAKLTSLLRSLAPDLRVVVPRRAKSNGTILALCARSIVMGETSELGPIDPFVDLAPDLRAPAHTLVGDGADPTCRIVANDAISHTRELARALLSTGMFEGDRLDDVDPLVDTLANHVAYHSHGAVIDAENAAKLGLAIVRLPADDPLWQKFWLLRCMYAHDLQVGGHAKIFEGRLVSNTLRTASRGQIRNPPH